MRSAVITGASTGIGWATAKLLLERGYRVFGSVRKQADADRLSGEFGEHFMPLIFDVTDEAAVLAAARQVREALNGETLAGLVNNAGIAVAGPMLELSADEFRRQMDVNVIGPVIATQAFGPLLGSEASLKGPRGRVVMISSVAGRNGNPLTAPYSASKHALEGLSESLRRELMLFNGPQAGPDRRPRAGLRLCPDEHRRSFSALGRQSRRGRTDRGSHPRPLHRGIAQRPA
jgi:NAD(P)-dependent dehydrogenase (short-subunit alcohol dehydrogenase family)